MPATPSAKVLIVDDEPNIALAIEFLMQQQGYQTQKAHDGRQALAALAHFQPDLIILDVMMPHMDGLELAHEVRKQAALSDTQIIFLTAKGTQRDKMDGYSAGGDLYLTKPFDNQELVRKVEELLE